MSELQSLILRFIVGALSIASIFYFFDWRLFVVLTLFGTYMNLESTRPKITKVREQ